MDGQKTFLPISNTHVYTALPSGPHPVGPPATDRRRPIKAFLVTSSGFLTLAFLVALIASYNGDNLGNNNTVINNNDASLSYVSMEPAKLMGPVSRGSPAGVSEKSNRPLFLGLKAMPAFPWSNDMLSWQRTSFHFQPEKNWMNGIYK